MIKIFYNCENCDKLENKEIRDFLHFVATKHATSEYTSRLDELVRRLKVTPREQLYYNNWLEITDDIREEGIAEGEQIGHERGVRASVL